MLEAVHLNKISLVWIELAEQGVCAHHLAAEMHAGELPDQVLAHGH